MAAAISTTDLLRSLFGDQPDILQGIGTNAYKKYPMVYKQCAEQRTTTKRMVEALSHKVLPEASEIVEHGQRVHSQMRQLWKTDIYMQYYQSNYKVSWQTLAHMDKKAKMKMVLTSTGERAFAHAVKKDRAFAVMLNNYDSNTQVYGDGLPIGSTAQLTGDGSTYSNLAASAADPIEENIISALRVIDQYADTGGKVVRIQAKKILTGTDKIYDVQRTLATRFKQGTDYNDVNLVNENNLIPGGAVASPHLANDGSWFIITDAPGGLVTWTFREPMFDMHDATDGTYAKEFTSLAAFVHGVGDKHGVYVFPRA